MRNTAKKLASAVIALAMTAAMSVTAYAADYALVPVFNQSTSESTPASSDEMSSAISSAVETEVDGEDKAVATVTVTSTANLAVKPSVLKDLAKKDGGVLEIVAPKVTISIDASTITKARNVDLSMKVTNSKARTIVNIKSKKNFGCEVKITLTECKLSAKKLASAHWYLDGEDMGPVELDEDGNPVVTLTKGGKVEVK
ncbi:MAG: hypothetical protein K2G87_03000 [Oscillospiraceae bacterium]|nr:hypothetical protein [Oscillospiraceae bacterium]